MRTSDLDYAKLVRAAKSLPASPSLPQVRIAILSDAATQQFVPLLRALFADQGFSAEIYEGAFDAAEIETVNAQSGLYEFSPDFVVIAECSQGLRNRYYQDSSSFLKIAESRLLRIWNALHTHTQARILQFNFALPYERQFGNFDLLVQDSFYSAVLSLNTAVSDRARARTNVLLCDVESVASWVGRRAWFDDRLWQIAKTFCNLEFLPLIAKSIVDIVLSTKGRVTKCIVADLDNTLWGGIVGDDGPLGIVVGAHGDGESFYHFQQYLLSLKRRGILLTVCSKNDLANAVAPFHSNPDMAIKRDDITVFIANWENKADNIRNIRDILEIGLDSMVFLDDNPFERNLVRETLPEVMVPELPEDPANYVRALSELNLFEASSFSPEDVARAALYKQEANRREVQTEYTNIDDFLKSLGMRMELSRFTAPKLARIAQLTQRSNQFNLTTNRYSEAQCEAMMLDTENCIPLAASLSDRFGDHGLISIVILRPTGDTLEITDWLMSCRVLVRGVEQAMMNHVVSLASERNLSSIQGDFIQTAKNSMVRSFYSQFGFLKTSEADGRARWSLEVKNFESNATFIETLL